MSLSLTNVKKARKNKGTGTQSSVEKPEKEERCGLFMLHDREDDSSNSVDIIAVHGLGGHWRKSWTEDNGKLWLRDFLPEQLRENGISARIMSYGYKFGTVFSRSVTNIDDEATMLLDRLDGERLTVAEKQRPIMFVAHGLGGILVKKTVVLAHERPNIYGHFLGTIKAGVFFGVPHRGSYVAHWRAFAGDLLKFGQTGFGTITAHITILRRNSETFANIAQQFVERGTLIRIRTFYETQKTGNVLIVDKQSARLGVPNEIAVGVRANHWRMCKFDASTSQSYKPIWLAILKLCNDLQTGEGARVDSRASFPGGQRGCLTAGPKTRTLPAVEFKDGTGTNDTQRNLKYTEFAVE